MISTDPAIKSTRVMRLMGRFRLEERSKHTEDIILLKTTLPGSMNENNSIWEAVTCCLVFTECLS